MSYKIGFSGPRKGMSTEQQKKLIERFLKLMQEHDEIEFHHGDCLGADDEADYHFDEASYWIESRKNDEIVVHPPSDYTYRAFVHRREHRCLLRVLIEEGYHKRNGAIIGSVDEMIAAAPTFEEIARGSGTWSVIRRTRKTRKWLTIIYPDGSIGQ